MWFGGGVGRGSGGSMCIHAPGRRWGKQEKGGHGGMQGPGGGLKGGRQLVSVVGLFAISEGSSQQVVGPGNACCLRWLLGSRQLHVHSCCLARACRKGRVDCRTTGRQQDEGGGGEARGGGGGVVPCCLLWCCSMLMQPNACRRRLDTGNGTCMRVYVGLRCLFVRLPGTHTHRHA
jgi:hypothetical protein